MGMWLEHHFAVSQRIQDLPLSPDNHKLVNYGVTWLSCIHNKAFQLRARLTIPQTVLESQILIGTAPNEEDFRRQFRRAGSKSLVAILGQHRVPVAQTCGPTTPMQVEM